MKKEWIGAIEAILFASGDPVGVDKIAAALHCKEEDVLHVAQMLMEKYNTPESGIHLLQLENDLQFSTNPAFIEPIRTVMELRRNTPLSQAAMEVLAVVAYNQPVTKAFVEQVRGVDCSGVLSSLMLKGLIEERGRLELPGRPLLYGTTHDFLRCMNLSSLEELPPLPKEEPAAQDGAEDAQNAEEAE